MFYVLMNKQREKLATTATTTTTMTSKQQQQNTGHRIPYGHIVSRVLILAEFIPCR